MQDAKCRYSKMKQILCPFRRKYVALTPEEHVRQSFLATLVKQGYPAGRIAVEVPFKSGDKPYRADAVVYDGLLRPVMLLEFKADSVPLSQSTLDQAVRYNRQLRVPYLLLHNGKTSVIAHIVNDQIDFLEEVPTYDRLH